MTTSTQVPSPFAALDANWNRIAENAVALKVSAGYVTIKFGPNFPGGGSTPTGLANDATVYTATAHIDGTDRAISIVGSAAQTMATLVTELIADVGTWSTVVLDGDTIVITSLTTGPTSAVFVSDTGANFLFLSVTGTSSHRFGVEDYDSTRGWTGPDALSTIAGSLNRVGTSYKGNTAYLRWDKLYDNEQDDVSSVIDKFLAFAPANTNVKWRNASASINLPTLPLTGPDTSSGLLRTTVYQLQVNQNGAGLVTVFVDMGIPQTSGVPFKNVVEAINIGLANAGLAVTAEWYYGYNATITPHIVFRAYSLNVPFTSTSTGALNQGTGSTLVVADGLASGLIAALNATFGAVLDVSQQGYAAVNFNRVNAAAVTPATVPGIASTTYSFTVTVKVGGVATLENVNVALLAADSLTSIATKMQTALRAATTETETVDAVGSVLLIADNDTGYDSAVTVTIPTSGANPDVFNAIKTALDTTFGSNTTVLVNSVDGFATPGVNGTTNLAFPKTYNGQVYTNWLDVLGPTAIGSASGSPSSRTATQFIVGPTGQGPIFTSDAAAGPVKENRPRARGECVRGLLYWSGAAWLYFTDDTSAGTNNPPESAGRTGF